MVLPSADQVGSFGSRLQSAVRFRVLPPLTGTTQMSFSIPRPFEHTNAIVWPSGDHAAKLLCAKPVRSARVVPSAIVSRNSAGYASSRTSVFSVESCSYTMVFPSRDQAGEVCFFQAEDGIRDGRVTGVQTCALPI